MKHSRICLLALCLVLIGSLVLPAAVPVNSFLSSAALADSIRLNKTKKTIQAGETLQLKLKGCKEEVTWRSSDTKVATVSDTGLVKGKKGGKAVITASAGGKDYTCKITVQSALTIPQDKLTLKKGKSKTIQVTLKLKTAKLTCKIDDAAVADISLGKRKGEEIPLKIKAKTPGVAVITLTNNKTKDKVTLRLTVKGENSGKLKGDIQELYGRTISEANALLEDPLKASGEFYVNDYVGVKVNKKGKINYLYVGSGKKYSLFGVTPGMKWSKGVDTLAAGSWEQQYIDSKGAWFSNPAYEGRVVYLEKGSGGKIAAVFYWLDK